MVFVAVLDGGRPQPKDAALSICEAEKQEAGISKESNEGEKGQHDNETAGSDSQDMADEWVYRDPQGVVQVCLSVKKLSATTVLCRAQSIMSLCSVYRLLPLALPRIQFVSAA